MRPIQCVVDKPIPVAVKVILNVKQKLLKIFLHVSTASPIVNQRVHQENKHNGKGIDKVHETVRISYHKTVEHHANRVEGMAPQVVELTGHFGHG